MEPKKVVTVCSVGHANDACLGRGKLEPQPVQNGMQGRQGGLGAFLCRTQHAKIVSVTYKGTQPVVLLLPRAVQAV